MTKGEVLTPKEAMFCEYYARSSSESYNKKRESAIRAGYADNTSAGNTATKLTTKKEVSMARIREIYGENVTRETPKHLSDLENHRLLALKLKRIDPANTAKKLQCQILGILPSDASATATTEQVKLSEVQQEQAKKFARWELLQGLNKSKEQQEIGAEILSESTEITDEL